MLNETNMTQEEKTRIEERIVDVLKTVYDPEIPVDIWNLGMIYKIDVQEDGTVDVDMTFTAPSCPAADFILEAARPQTHISDPWPLTMAGCRRGGSSDFSTA